METKMLYADVESYCQEMHVIANKIKDIFDGINDEFSKVSGNWDGTASEYCKNKCNELKTFFEPIYNEIEYSILFMAKCSDGYKAIDEKVVSEICNNLEISEPNLSGSVVFSNTGYGE